MSDREIGFLWTFTFRLSSGQLQTFLRHMQMQWHEALQAAGVPLLIHYLDHFLISCHPLSDEGHRFLHVAQQVLEDLTTPVAWPKPEDPSKSVTFLGILIDTDRLELRLPFPKLARLRFMLCN